MTPAGPRPGEKSPVEVRTSGPLRPRVLAFALLAVLSLGFVQAIRVGVASILPVGPAWEIANVMTVFGGALLFLLVTDGRALWDMRPDARWLLVTLLLLVTVLPAPIGPIFFSNLPQQAPQSFDFILAFAFLGPVAEEFLFRGAVYEVARDLWPRRVGPVSVAVWVSSALFALSHFQYHGFLLSGPSLAQVGYTFPMGLIVGYAREETGSIWPPIIGHLLSNLMFVSGGFVGELWGPSLRTLL